MRVLVALLLGLTLSHASVAQAQDFTADPEVLALFMGDQSGRTGGKDVSPGQREADDTIRRQAMRKLLDDGRLTTADDYFLAAFVFQHGRGDDCLLAHTLAVVALAKGKAEASVIAANTLDRYLQDIGRAQIYGTQFMMPFNGDPATQGKYDAELLPDSLRQAMDVPTTAQQAQQVTEMQLHP